MSVPYSLKNIIIQQLKPNKHVEELEKRYPHDQGPCFIQILDVVETSIHNQVNVDTFRFLFRMEKEKSYRYMEGQQAQPYLFGVPIEAH